MRAAGGSHKNDHLRLAALEPTAETLEQAREGFHRAAPRRSARRVLHWSQIFAGLALAAGLVWLAREFPSETARTAYWLAFTLFATAILWRLFAAASLAPVRRKIFTPSAGAWPTYTILCPLHCEANVVADLVAALERLDYPRHALDIQLLLEADDVDTIAAALAAAQGSAIRIVLIPAAAPRTKPKALNVGLALARGDFLAVYDAEDRPHPQQLRAALAAFDEGGECLACVQAPLVIDNAHDSWIASQFAAEYAIQFREILPLLARMGAPIPLGGSSNHFRTDALRQSGGWDPYNVTEDADLGYRFAREGKRGGIIAAPTFEEAPVSFNAWLDQRTRWIKGHLQTWLVLMRNPFRSASEMGLGAFWSMHLVLGLGILASLAHGPIAIVLFVAAATPFDLLGPADFTLALSGYAAAAFAALSAAALSGDLSHARAALTMPLYWPLSSIAAYRALWELIRHPHHWAKTTHGISRARAAPFPAPPAAPEAQTLDTAQSA
jgi:cellulose synthase/poly-beta-1,6-N-acetylglucosamine synthase-like glycosyltransferase